MHNATPARVADDELDTDDALFVLHNGEYFTGIGFEALPDGRVIGETEYARGLRHGAERIWYRSGQLKSEAHYAKGVSEGVQREWYENGQLKAERRYAAGKIRSEQRWTEHGTPLPPTSGA